MAGLLKYAVCLALCVIGPLPALARAPSVDASQLDPGGAPLATAVVHSGNFEHAGLTLHYRVTGEGTPVLILAGGPGFDADYMMPVAAMVAESHMAILLDQRGTGQSRPATMDRSTVNEDLVVEDIEALRIKLGVDRIDLVGHSFGTFTAMRYAIAHPEHTGRIVLLATMPPRAADQTIDTYIGKRLTPESLARLRSIDAAMDKASPAQRETLNSEMSTLILPAYLFDQAKLDAVLAAMAGTKLHADTGQLIWDSIGNYDITSQLAIIRSPVAIIQGRQDVLDVGVAQKTHDAIPGSHLVLLEQCGHFAWIEQPVALRTAMLQFFED